MTKPLDGVRVATTENRFPEQLARLLERQGATVDPCPLLRETPIEHVENARQFMELCETTTVDFIIFYTGVGVEFLFRTMDRPEVIARSRILARGPKAVNALKKFGVRVDLVADAPTTEGILKTLAREVLHGKSIIVQLYGHENLELRTGLEAMGGTVTGISLYHYEQASDTEAISELIRRIMQGEVDVITFTTGTQAQFLLRAVSEEANAALLKRFEKDVFVASIGEVTTRVLRDLGIQPHIVPEEPKMGPMVKAIADFFKEKPGMFYPVFIDLRNRPVLVVGGGTVAERKVENLLESDARVTVVSPESTGTLRELARANRIVLHQRRFLSTDIDGVLLVISATNDSVVQTEIASIASSKNILVNTVDKPDLCTFIVPAILRRGDVTLAISTSGKSPSLAAALRERFGSVLTEEVSRTASLLGDVRHEVHERFPDDARRKIVFERIIDSGIVEWIGECDDAAALERVRQIINEFS